MELGHTLKELRKKKRLTLLELSNKSGVAIATLSRMENGRMTGTVGSHEQICKALDVSLSDLYRNLEDRTKTVESAEHALMIEHSNGPENLSRELFISNTLDKKMLPMLIKLGPGSGSKEERNNRGSEKFIYVTRGAIEININGRKYPLKQGATLYFDASLSHSFSNNTKNQSEFLSIQTVS
ncbi:MAG: helix-turn-helix transcriptional regulator [Candidatus Omnitrophica bacterium]|nr:helix-turn-helix transcriptional regulator [Candidatus Omnitrophota bacterium]